jgi:cobalt-zinc-cadmium efflux system outer membrane protein
MRTRGKRLSVSRLCVGIAALAGGLTGCAGSPRVPPPDLPTSKATWAGLHSESDSKPSNVIRTVSHQAPIGGPSPASHPPVPGDELSADVVVREVLSRNPTLAQMSAAVQAAAARYPQVTSLDDPSFSSWVAPASLGSNKVNDSARFEISQKFPYPGKRALRGESASAQTAAAEQDLEDIKLQLVESALAAHAEYYQVERSLEVNREGLQLLDEIRRNATSLYETGKAPQQDVIQVEVEIGRQNERRFTLERTRTVAIARLNTLMNRSPDAPLPPAPKVIPKPEAIPDPAVLREAAMTRRPDLRALAARLAADQAAVALARKEYYPDVEAMAAYDSFWQAADDQQRLRAQVGLRVNLPIRLDRRGAAVREAEALFAQRIAELDRQTNRVAFEVQEAHARLTESAQAARLYEGSILPTALRNVRSAQTAYTTGKVPLLSLVEAQRNLIELRDRSYQTLAEYQQRRAILERVIGGPVPPSSHSPFPAKPTPPATGPSLPKTNH